MNPGVVFILIVSYKIMVKPPLIHREGSVWKNVDIFLIPWSRVFDKQLVRSANQDIPCLLRNQKVHYRVHKELATGPSPKPEESNSYSPNPSS
jgi:hypothetical protein